MSRQNLQQRIQRERMKLCVGCGQRPMKFGRVRCEECLQKSSRSTAEASKQRKEAGLCIYFGCDDPLSEGHVYCDGHLKKMLAYVKERRTRMKTKRVCIDNCGRKPECPPHLRCITCEVIFRTQQGFEAQLPWIYKGEH